MIRNPLKLHDITRFRLFAGIFVGLGTAFSYYALFYITREIFRIMSVTEDSDLWLLTDAEVNYYNLIFAFIACILGQSACIGFWLDGPKSGYERFFVRRRNIVNEQRNLNWYFLAWFSKLGIAYGIMFGPIFIGGYHVFSFYPDYNFMFILIVIVLFLQSWVTLRKSYRNSIVWMIGSMLFITITSFGLSRINIIDYKALNHSILKNNVYYKYRLVHPRSDLYNTIRRRPG